MDGEQCNRDATLMKTLGANTLRIYHVDPKEDHSKCMATFAEAGIYTLIDLDTFDTYILPVCYASPLCLTDVTKVALERPLVEPNPG